MSAHAAEPPGAMRRSLSAWLRPLLPLLGSQRSMVLLSIALRLVHQLLLLASAGTGAYLVAEAAAGATAAQLRAGVIVLCALAVPATVAMMAGGYVAHVAGHRVLVDVRDALYSAFERLSPGYMLERRSGDLGSTAISDVEQLENFFSHMPSPLVVAALVPVVTGVALLTLHWSLALALAPALALLATIPSWLRRRAEAQGRQVRETLGEISAETVDVFQGLRELVAFGAGAQRLALLRQRGRTLRAAHIAHGRRSGLERAATDTITVAGVLAVLVTGTALVADGSLDRTWLPVAVVPAAGSLLPVIKVIDAARELNLTAAAADRITAVLEASVPVSDLVQVPPDGPVEPRIGFHGVSFRYGPGLREAVTDATFEVGPGETVALVGHSGAGKSTCANLLLRLWDPERGAITIGGHDVRDYPQENLDPDVLIALYGFGDSTADSARDRVLGASELGDITAVRKGNILVVRYQYAGHGYLAIEGLEILADQLAALQ